MKSYYEILGIAQTASEDEIVKAFRKQAMKLHPDRNPNDPTAEEKFKEMKMAYETLSDPYKRQQYDLLIAPKSKQSSKSNSNSGSSSNNSSSNNNNFFSTEATVSIGFWEAVFGCTKTFEFNMPHGTGQRRQKITVTFPPGTRQDESFVYSVNGLKLQINVQFLSDDRFTRNNLDLFTNIEIPFTLAALGGKLIFPHWDGELEIVIPQGVKPNQHILVHNKGVKREIFIGDLYLICNISVPKKLTPKQKFILEEFKKTEIEEPNNILDSIRNTWKNIFSSTPKN